MAPIRFPSVTGSSIETINRIYPGAFCLAICTRLQLNKRCRWKATRADQVYSDSVSWVRQFIDSSTSGGACFSPL
jgi:hypothetical protein